MSAIQLSKNSAYSNLLQSYQKLSQQDDKTHKVFFTALSKLYPTIGLGVVRDLSSGNYYREADLINTGKSFKKFPKSLKILQPLAENYCLTFDEIKLLLRNPPKKPELLKEKLNQLGNDHSLFRETFVEELKIVCADTPAMISINYPQTISLFLDTAFSNFEGLNKDLILPLAIEKLLDPAEPIPELFQSRNDLVDLRNIFVTLSATEKEALHLKLLGQDIHLAGRPLELFEMISDLSSSLQKEKKPGLILGMALGEINKATPLLGSISTRDSAARALLNSYLNDPSLTVQDLPEALYDEKYRLPIASMKRQIQSGSKVDEGEIRKVASLIGAEPKAAPWIRLVNRIRA